MQEGEDKQKLTILQVLEENGGVVGSNAIAEALAAYGYTPSPRSIRQYLQEMETDGLVEESRRGRGGGRSITPRGRQELRDSMIFDRVGLMAAKVDGMAYQMDFDLARRQGRVVLNLTVLAAEHFAAAAAQMLPVFEAKLSMGEYVCCFQPGDRVGDTVIPRGHVGIGTICSVTVNGVLLNARIPVVSRFGGVLEVNRGIPVRFTEMIDYAGTSLDPIEIFIKARLTDLRGIVERGQGRISASFREVPNDALEDVRRLCQELDRAGLGGVLCLGKPNRPLLSFSVPLGRTGMIVTGGLNPAAAVNEAGIPIANTALSMLYDFERLQHYRELASFQPRV